MGRGSSGYCFRPKLRLRDRSTKYQSKTAQSVAGREPSLHCAWPKRCLRDQPTKWRSKAAYPNPPPSIQTVLGNLKSECDFDRIIADIACGQTGIGPASSKRSGAMTKSSCAMLLIPSLRLPPQNDNGPRAQSQLVCIFGAGKNPG